MRDRLAAGSGTRSSGRKVRVVRRRVVAVDGNGSASRWGPAPCTSTLRPRASTETVVRSSTPSRGDVDNASRSGGGVVSIRTDGRLTTEFLNRNGLHLADTRDASRLSRSQIVQLALGIDLPRTRERRRDLRTRHLDATLLRDGDPESRSDAREDAHGDREVSDVGDGRAQQDHVYAAPARAAKETDGRIGIAREGEDDRLRPKGGTSPNTSSSHLRVVDSTTRQGSAPSGIYPIHDRSEMRVVRTQFGVGGPIRL